MSDNQNNTAEMAIKRFKMQVLRKYNVDLYIRVKENSNLDTIDIEDGLTLQQYKDVVYESLILNYPEFKRHASITARCREKVFVMHRQLLFYLVWQDANYSKSSIGRSMERNHATIINGIRQVENYLETKDKLFAKVYNQVKININKHVGTLSNNLQEPVDTEPSSHTVWNETENSVTEYIEK